VENSDLFKEIAYELDTRGAITVLTWVKVHSGIKGNEEADERAKIGAKCQELILGSIQGSNISKRGLET